MFRATRVAAAAFTVAAAAALPITAASPAQADYDACVEFLASNGFEGEAAAEACQAGADGDIEACVAMLLDADLDPAIAFRSCILALQPAA